MTPKNKFDQLVKQQGNIVLTTHINPDADAVCSLLAVYQYIKRKWPKKKVRMIISDQPSDLWSFLPQATKIEWVKNLADHLKEVDLIIFLDGNYRERFSPTPGQIDLTQLKSICVDHHLDNLEKFTLNLSNPSAIATCQIVAEILFADKRDLDKGLAEVLLIGILGDSGNFRYFNYQNSAGLETVKRLIDIGRIDIQSLLLKIDKISQAEFEIIKILVNNTTNVELENAPNLTYSYLPKSILKRFQDKSIISRAYHHYLYFFVRQIENHPWGFVVVPKGKNKFGISFRSSPGGPNVKRLAEMFGGSGHNLAAAARYWTDAKDRLDSRDIVQRVLEKIKNTNLERYRQ